jgi:hypothetical protein
MEARQVRSDLPVRSFLIGNVFLRAKRLTTLLPGSFATPERGSPSKTSGTMVEPGLVVWSWCVGASCFVSAAVCGCLKHHRGPPPSLLPCCGCLWLFFFCYFREWNRSYKGAVSRMSMKFGENVWSFYTRFKNNSSNASESRCNSCPVAYTWKRTNVKKTTTTNSSGKCM